MLLNENGLDVSRLDPALAQMLGNSPGQEGSLVLAQAAGHDASRVELRHWLFCLALAPGGLLRTHLIESKGKKPERFVEIVEDSLGPLPPGDHLLRKLTPDVVGPEVSAMLEAAERLAEEAHLPVVNEAVLTMALLDTCSGALAEILTSYAAADGLQRLRATLRAYMVGETADDFVVEDLFDSPLLAAGDVLDWKGLCSALASSATSATSGAARCLWEILLDDARRAVQDAVHAGAYDRARGPLRRGLNDLLRRRELSREAGLAAVGPVDEPPASTLNKKTSPLAAETQALLRNRRCLEVVFPSQIARCTRWDGRLRLMLFDPSGRRFCKRLQEEMAGLGAHQVTTFHLLYTLLGTETLLFRALAVRGIDVKKDLHQALSRQLARPGAKRNTTFDLTAESLMGGVTDVLIHAVRLARGRGASLVSEDDVCRAFLQRSDKTLRELFPRDKPLDMESVRAYVELAQPDSGEEELPLQRYTVRQIEEAINQHIRGQSQAIEKVMPWVKRLRFGLRRDNRPAAVFLFLGPTGTGKTQMAKELARYVYGSEDALLFLEMGQFQTKESMSGFIGAPPGYVGYGEGKLTNGLRDKPECVVLFDEIEKAHTEVFDALLRFSDEGLISDPAGPVRDGTRCILVMTTNAGQEWLQTEYLRVDEVMSTPAQLAETLAKAREDGALPGLLLNATREELSKRGFRPEFIGRVDDLVTFLPLDKQTCRQILDDVLRTEAAKLMDLKGIELKIEEPARDVLANLAVKRSLKEGARGIPRTVNEYVVSAVINVVTSKEEQGAICRVLTVYPVGSSTIEVAEP
jgi:ATP-dependent Clp protease ATP-binding subunit ClpC